MSNMSYCRFQSTLPNLRDCYEAWEDELSEEETRAKVRMLKLCKEIVEAYGDDE